MRKLTAIVLFALLPVALYAQSSAVPAWKLYYDSAQLYWAKDWKKTVPLLVQAERSALSDLGIYDENYLTIINDLGLAYAKTKDYATAEKFLNKSLSIKTELKGDLGPTLTNLAGVHAEQGHSQQAEQFYKRILAEPTAEPDIVFQAKKQLVQLYETQGQFDAADKQLEAFRSAVSGDAPGNNGGYEIDLARGRIKRKLRKYEEARGILEDLMKDLQGQNDKKLISLYVQSLQESGLLYFETGALSKAEKNLLQGFRVLKSNAPVDNNLLTEVLNSLGSVYEKLGIYDKATVYYQEAVDICSQVQGKNSIAFITLQSNIAGIQLKQGNSKSAIESYLIILKDVVTLIPESDPFYITILNNLATAYRKNNQSREASAYLEKAYQLIQNHKLDNSDLAATIMNNLAVLLTANGESAKAIGYYEKAYQLKKVLYGENSVLLMDLASNMAVVYWETNKRDLAIPFFQKSIALAVHQIKYIFPSLSENEQVQFYHKLKEDFERFNTIAFQAAYNKPEILKQVFDNQITIKSLLFFTQQHRNNLINEKKDTVLNQQYELLKARREQLGYFYQLSLKELASAETSAAELEQEIDKLEKSISLKTSETIAEKMMEQDVHWTNVQQKLQPEEALVEIIRFRKYDLRKYQQDNADRVSFGFTDSVYYAALVTTHETRQSPKFVLMKEGTNMESRFLSYYRNAITYDVPDQNSFAFYWRPFESFIGNRSKVYISGDGVYHRLNLNSLQEPETHRYLVERYDIHYLLNPMQFLEKQKVVFDARAAVLIGDPAFDLADITQAKNRDAEKFSSLPGTYKEIMKIDEILKGNTWNTTLFLKRLATERNIKNVHSPDILHIATHGFFSTDRVKLNAEAKKDFLFYSGLVLAGANRNLNEETPQEEDDGILTAYEVMNLDLTRTHLVVLSACETGLGRVENGEGVYGLQRSFLQAGARNILISLWKVDDQITQELMVNFYKHLFNGKSEREALKLAQLELLKKTDNPRLWAGFIVVGLD